MNSISETTQLFGMTILLICILIFRFLLHQEKKRFLLLIMLLYIVSFILSLLHYIRDGLGFFTQILEGVTYFFWLASVILLYLSITSYFEKKVDIRIIAGLGMTVIWIFLALNMELGYVETTLPLISGLSGYLIYAGILFIKQDTPSTRAGRIITGGALILLAMQNFGRTFIPTDDHWLMKWSYFFETIFQLVITIGISFIYFENKQHFIKKYTDDLEVAVAERTRELEISKNRFLQVFENTPSGILWADVHTGILINCNKAAEEILGYPREEIIGHPFLEFHPQDKIEEYKAFFLECVDKQRIDMVEVEIVSKSGEVLPCEISASVTHSNGEHIIQASFRDIRERKTMEEERDKMVSLIDNSSDFIGLGTLDGKVLYMNRAGCAMVGMDQEDIQGQDGFAFIPPDEMPKVNEIITPALYSEGRWSGEAEIYNIKTGKRLPVFITIFMITDPHTDVPICTGSIMKDISSWKESQRELIVSEKRMRALLNAITESAFLMSPTGTVLAANETVAQRFSIPHARLVGSNVYSWLPEELAEARRKKAEEVIETKDAIRFEDERFGRIVDTIIYPVLNEKNEVSALTVIGRDVTEEKEAESFNDFQRKITDTLSIVDDIKKGSSVLLKILSDLECIGWAGVFLATREKIECIAQKKIRTIPVDEATYYTKLALEKISDSDEFMLYSNQEELTGIEQADEEARISRMAFYHIAGIEESTILLQLEARDSSGFPVFTKRLMEQLVPQLTEIFSRMLIKYHLKSSEARFSAVMNSMDDIIFTLGKDMSFTGVYGKWTDKWKIEKDDFMGKHPAEIFGAADLKLHEDAYQIALMGQNTIYEWNAVIDGSPRSFQTLLTPLLEEDGTISGVVGVGRDTTRSKMIEGRIKKYTDELERSNKELEQFAYITSHDLKEPLRTITNFIQLLEYKYKESIDERGRGYIARVVSGAKRMEQMISDLLTYSRVTTHGQPFAKVDSAGVFKNALENLQITIERKEAIVTAEALNEIIGDEIQLIRLFQNLISNAIKYCEEDTTPHIHVSMDEAPDSWIFSIADNGIGIPMDQKDRIFQIFQRLHTRSRYSGTGIGLAVCKRIVERHGGRIWVESEEGNGSVFYFTIAKKLSL